MEFQTVGVYKHFGIGDKQAGRFVIIAEGDFVIGVTKVMDANGGIGFIIDIDCHLILGLASQLANMKNNGI